MSRVLLFNPRSARYKPRIPNSILSVASALEGAYDYVIVDGNLEDDPWEKIHRYLSDGSFGYFGCTSMPGPQLKQSRSLKRSVNCFPLSGSSGAVIFPPTNPNRY
jgi:anaerobic magnesium-protoporphyrin IX monomethyl ester cyclase